MFYVVDDDLVYACFIYQDDAQEYIDNREDENPELEISTDDHGGEM